MTTPIILEILELVGADQYQTAKGSWHDGFWLRGLSQLVAEEEAVMFLKMTNDDDLPLFKRVE